MTAGHYAVFKSLFCFLLVVVTASGAPPPQPGENVSNLPGKVSAAGAIVLPSVPDILTQTGMGFPKTWGTNHGQPVPADYILTSAAPGDVATTQKITAALQSLATCAILADPADLFSADTGIYTHPLERGGAWERGVALALFETNGQLAFQTRCGLRIHGGVSRQPEESPKHSFRLAFKTRYGPARLRFPLFGAGGGQEFDRLVLRAGNDDSWLTRHAEDQPRATYVRDEWMRRSMAAMGHPSARGRFVHLYLNGLYWGVYNLCESPGPGLLAGDAAADNFDIRKGGKIEAGDDTAWNQMLALANAGVSDDRQYAAIRRSLDLTEFADYMLLNFYAGNADWDRSANWVAMRPHTAGGRFQFLVWDGECTLGDLESDTVDFDDDESPPRLFHKLAENAAFRKLFATRAQQLLFGDGALAPEKCAERLRTLTNSAAAALAAEAARWGNYRHDLKPPSAAYATCAVEQCWQPEVQRLLKRYFPERRAFVLNQFRERGLFP